MEYVDLFFEKGGYTFLSDLEERYKCASLCKAPLFYISQDVSEGPPEVDCLTALAEDITSNSAIAGVAAVTGILLLISTAGGFVLCSKKKEDDMMDEKDA